MIARSRIHAPQTILKLEHTIAITGSLSASSFVFLSSHVGSSFSQDSFILYVRSGGEKEDTTAIVRALEARGFSPRCSEECVRPDYPTLTTRNSTGSMQTSRRIWRSFQKRGSEYVNGSGIGISSTMARSQCKVPCKREIQSTGSTASPGYAQFIARTKESCSTE